jgi:hypothetical protein
MKKVCLKFTRAGYDLYVTGNIAESNPIFMCAALCCFEKRMDFRLEIKLRPMYPVVIDGEEYSSAQRRESYT